MNNQPQPQQPQKCPRCESLNTKFCYYNNYSLSQPRYFCKACRRYWTQGGTLRNVRVGGGCRKAKRAKSSTTSSSSADADSAPSSQPPQEADVQKDPSAKNSPAAATAAAAVPSISLFCRGVAGGDGGYLSSLTGIESLNPSQPFNQMGSCSNLSLLSGFGVPSLGSHIRPSQQFYQMGVVRDREEEPMYESEQVLIQSTMAKSGSASSHHHWTETFINNVNHSGSDASLWSTTVSTTSAGGDSKSNNPSVGGSFSLIPDHQWPDLPEFDPPP